MDFNQARFNMVEQQIRPWNVLDFDVLDALLDIPREHFVSDKQQGYAYADMPLTLPNGSQMLEPKIVARMIQGLRLKKTDTVLEIGTGSGYASAVLSKLCAQVYSFDIDAAQSTSAASTLEKLGITNVRLETADGLDISKHQHTYDAIYIGGSLNTLPEQLKALLNDGGRMVAVVGSHPVQRCILLERQADTFHQTTLFDTLITALHNTHTGTHTNTFRF